MLVIVFLLLVKNILFLGCVDNHKIWRPLPTEKYFHFIRLFKPDAQFCFSPQDDETVLSLATQWTVQMEPEAPHSSHLPWPEFQQCS